MNAEPPLTVARLREAAGEETYDLAYREAWWRAPATGTWEQFHERRSRFGQEALSKVTDLAEQWISSTTRPDDAFDFMLDL